jgi:D-arginine dehydrogenase
VDADFLIIGGGIAGVSAAAHLAPLGSVLLLEAEDALAHHASGRSAATYEPDYGSPAVVALSHASGDAFRAMPGVLGPRDLMLVARADEAEAFHADGAAMGFRDLALEDAFARLPILNPAVVAFAGLATSAADIDTDLLLQTWLRAAKADGARVELKARVTAIARDGDAWSVAWSGGSARARHIVNAAGAWVDQVAAMAGVAPLGFTPLRRSMARIPAPQGHDVSGWPMVFGPGESWYAKPDAGALIVSPAEEDPADPHDAWADDMVLAEGLARFEAYVTTPVTRLIASWAGLRTFAPDRALVIGPDARAPSFLWLAGQGGQGFQSSAGAATLLADLIAGRSPSLPADVVQALSPARFG